MSDVYVAGPLGFAASTKPYHELVLAGLEERGLSYYDPWAGTAPPSDPAELAEWSRRNGRENAAAIDGCTVVLANLDGVDVDSGTAAEIGYAAAQGKVVIGLRTDVRQTGENDTVDVNLQVQWFIESTGGEVFRDLESALDAVSAALT